ncbi:MAG: V-type ATP synthase subunit I [Acidaminococcaceae bacterium]
MKKATLYALKDDREAILLNLQRGGNLMLIATSDGNSLPGIADVDNALGKAQEAIKFITVHAGKPSLFAPKPIVQYEHFLQKKDEGAALSNQLTSLAEKITTLRNEAATMLAQAKGLEPWAALDVALENLSETDSSVYFAGFLATEEVEAVQDTLKEMPAELLVLGEGNEGRALVIFAHKTTAAEVKGLLKDHDFSPVIFPKRTGVPQEIISDLTQAASMKEGLAEELEGEAAKLADKAADLRLYYDQLAVCQERLFIGGEETEQTFCLQGWLRADRQADVSKAVAEATAVYDLKFEEPAEEEIPPSVMENVAFAAPYEAVTEMYSRPKIGSLDPSFMMAPWHFIFFGMMLSDAGYGLVLTILLFIVLKVLKPEGGVGKLVTVIFFGSISTIFWGAMFGGWFGLEFNPILLSPMNEPLKMLALCFGLGAVHIILGVCMKMYLEIKRGQLWNAVFDQLSWLVIFAGLGLMAFAPDKQVGQYLALSGMTVIILTGGREKKNIFRRLLSGVLSLYNISGYFSDLLSYSRLFALGLSTGVIAMVINTIAHMLWQAGPVGIVIAVVFLLLGHTFNIAVNIMGAFVHTSRLQYIEFFGKFFEPGGRAFKPLAIRTKYVNVSK